MKTQQTAFSSSNCPHTKFYNFSNFRSQSTKQNHKITTSQNQFFIFQFSIFNFQFSIFEFPTRIKLGHVQTVWGTEWLQATGLSFVVCCCVVALLRCCVIGRFNRWPSLQLAAACRVACVFARACFGCVRVVTPRSLGPCGLVRGSGSLTCSTRSGTAARLAGCSKGNAWWSCVSMRAGF